MLRAPALQALRGKPALRSVVSENSFNPLAQAQHQLSCTWPQVYLRPPAHPLPARAASRSPAPGSETAGESQNSHPDASALLQNMARLVDAAPRGCLGPGP